MEKDLDSIERGRQVIDGLFGKDVDFSYDTRTKKITTGQYSING